MPPVVSVYVVVSAQVAKDDQGNVAAMVETLEAELHEAGYQVSIVPARDDETPPASRLELRVLTSEAADREFAAGAQLGGYLLPVVGVAAMGGGGGEIVVEAYWVPGGNGKPTHLGRFAAGTFMAMAEDTQTVAGERAGRRIASNLFK